MEIYLPDIVLLILILIMSCVLVYIFLWCHTRICRPHIQPQDNQQTRITVNNHQTPVEMDLKIAMPE